MMNSSIQTSSHARTRKVLANALLLGLAAIASPASFAYKIENGDFRATLDSTLTYGVNSRVQDIDPRLIGKCNLQTCLPLPLGAQSPAAQRNAPGRFSTNGDDGDRKYRNGDIFSNTLKLTSEFGFSYGENWGGLIRATGFYDFENEKRNDISELAKRKVGKGAHLLDAFVYHNFDDGKASVRAGKQVISWGESTFIQQGINVVNPVDVSKLRVAGSELKEAFIPLNMLWGSYQFNDNLSAEALYLLEYQQTEPEPAGTYFSTNDFATLGGEYVMLGFGLFPERFPAVTVPRLPDKFASEKGQYGAAVRYFSPELNDSEFALYYLNYHSRLPLISGYAVTNSNANSARYFVEYPEDINLYGLSMNTQLPWGVAFQGEVSYRPNVPLQIDDVEVLFYALSPLNALIPAQYNRFQSQLGVARPGQYTRGWERHEMTQLQFTLTKVFGPEENPFGADQVSAVAEFGFTDVWDLPAQSVLRYQGDGTDTGGGSTFETGASRNPATQIDGFPTKFSWGYRLAAKAEYNNFLGSSFTVSPRLAYNHDVNGISPGPGGNFVEGRRSITVGVETVYLSQWSVDLSYNAFFGAGNLNLIHDRDFVSVIAKYSF
jgi:hypothetical protein